MISKLNIVLASDHVGYPMKKELQEYLTILGHDTFDVGTHSTASANYPIYGRLAADKLANGAYDRAVLVCGTGFGISLAANSVTGVRCVNCTDMYTAYMSRLHNNANAIALGCRVIAPELAKLLLETWLSTEFEGGRHAERVDMLTEMGNYPASGEYNT